MTLINSISLISRRAIGKLLPSVKVFVARAKDDGAIVEGTRCLNNAIIAINSIDGAAILFDAYNLRVVAASGSTEARTCTINELNEIL